MNKSLAKFQRKAAKQEPEDEIEKIRLSFFQQDAPLLAHDQRITLSRTQLEKRDFYTKVWGMLLTKPDSEVEELIMQLKGCKRGMAMYIINQSQKLFGSIKTINREAQRAIRIAQREAEIRLIENDQILDKLKMPDVIRTSDPAALAQDTEDIDHEESADDEEDLS
jgi:hypothetical protein